MNSAEGQKYRLKRETKPIKYQENIIIKTGQIPLRKQISWYYYIAIQF